jgi:murein DD-endopeptidase MepM/ murein hydrolase activator NlpD
MEFVMRTKLAVILTSLAILSCGKPEMKSWQLTNLPQGYADSHILSIDIENKQIIIGTYGRGALISENDGQSWTVFDTSKGISWDFILGGIKQGNYIALATLGDGANISTDNGAHWERYGYNFFGVEYLYAVGIVQKNNIRYMPTADGLVVFGDSIKEWHALTEKDGLASQYLYDMAIDGSTMALGSLHGIAVSFDDGKSWSNFAPNGKKAASGLPLCKVRTVALRGDAIYAGCDDGLFMSKDKGNNWSRIGQTELSSEFIHDLVFDKSNNLWVATYKEVACYNPQSGTLQVSTTGLPRGSINCLGVGADGEIFAGTNYGLYRLTSAEAQPATELAVDTEFMQSEEPLHQTFIRPVSPEEQNGKDQTYLYGSTMGGNFRQHQGNEYNNPEGVPTLAVDDGVIVFTDTSIGHAVLKCVTPYLDKPLYAHYHHQHEIIRKVGDKVKRGEQIGTIGKKGNVTNEHLHFEVATSETGSQIDSVSTTRNSELWVAPLPGCGTIVGMVVDSDGKPIGGARIYGVTKPGPTETPFSFAETYRDKVHPDSLYGENFALGDVPAGVYTLYTKVDGAQSRIKVKVEAAKVTRVSMQLK